ncbi:MAG: LamG-like jellyroll fold domain-containing protein [Limisphaerales bacterium]
MRWKEALAWVLALMTVVGGAGCGSISKGRGVDGRLRSALTFHAPFDRGTDAEYALADPWIYQAPSMSRIKEAKPGLPAGDLVKVVPGQGRHGGALRYAKKTEAVVFFKGKGNVPWVAQEWGGTISFWLRTDFKELADGYTDPMQVTTRSWNDGAIFTEFEKRTNGVPFRLGAYADFKVWNPKNRDWGAIPKPELPLITVNGPPFSGDRWTHVAITWERFNTGRADGLATLHLDGVAIASIRNRTQTFTWEPSDIRLMLGVGYVGWIDDLSVFNRALTPEEIQRLRVLPQGVRSLVRR